MLSLVIYHLFLHYLKAAAVAERHRFRKGAEEDPGKPAFDFPSERGGIPAGHDDNRCLLTVVVVVSKSHKNSILSHQWVKVVTVSSRTPLWRGS